LPLKFLLDCDPNYSFDSDICENRIITELMDSDFWKNFNN
jgi:hypothetical protein